ncbi:WASH complex subunit 2 isoform X2 [Syngnathus acus]|uniref:WASH complex subunit 2 isoform X2 n=1 Tax=Syngnathus acus TaxID=161584 RepID=UPI001885DDD0|nr:WASH complex subunit 2 isoform X2 [Syngnathus acus]
MNGMSDGMSNGPDGSEHPGNDAQVWERPWTLDEMRQSSANWSLAADSGLFLFLQDFSQRMLSRTHEMEKQLDSLIRDTKATDSSLHSVFNDFLMLSNTQFIENRVYDEEVEEPVPKTDAADKQADQKSREQKEAELIPKMQEAVTYGLKVLESAFEHLDIKAGNSDSEDEEASDRLEAILEPKDLYVDRPLPFLIGSQAFMEQEDVGLGDLSSDELSVDSERDSVIDSEDIKDEDNSDEDFMQEADRHSNKKKASSMVSSEEDEDDDDSDIFGESDKEEEDAKSAGPSSSFADELAARIKGEVVSKPTGDRASDEDDSDDMFKPPKMESDDDKDDEDEFSPFGGKSGLFSGGKGLFDDDDEGDLFSDAPRLPVSKEEKSTNESIKTATKAAEPDKAGKKIPPGAVSVFPDNNLFNPVGDGMASRENGASTGKSHVTPKPAPVAGGLFDEEDDDQDDFFSVSQVKPKQAPDLFKDEDGDIFSEKAAQKKEAEQPLAQSEKKMPAGAISMFGPGTQSLLSEGLKKRQTSRSDESDKSEKNGLNPDVGPAVTQTQKPLTSRLFSDDKDTQIFPTIPKSQSDPHTMSQSRINKPPLSLFDDDDEEDLFASASNSKPKSNPAKTATQQPSKALSSSLFSDDEDQWLSPQMSATTQESQTGGMKPSASAPSSLPSVMTSQKGSLFDDDDDLFAPVKELSPKTPQRSLLFEDEDDEDKGSLFGIKTDEVKNAAAKPTSLLEKSPDSAKKGLKEKPSVPQKPPAKPPETPSPSSESTEIKKKPVGAVSLFGGIDVLAKKQAKSILDEDDDERDGPPPMVNTQEKVKSNAFSLFDDDDEQEDEQDPIFNASKPTARNTAKPAEERPQAKSTGVFQDEELLFSPTKQKDNDPDVDLFAVSDKTTSSELSSAKPAPPSLFLEDEEDDLFASSKPQSPSKVAAKHSTSTDRPPPVRPETVSEIQKPALLSPAEPKEPTSRIGKLQASLKINPAAFFPGSAPSMPGAVSVLPGLDPSSSSGVSSSSISPSPATTPIGARTDSEPGIGFDAPLQVPTLQSANKNRVRASIRRRPQSRAARQASQRSADDQEQREDNPPGASTSDLFSSVPPPSDHSSQTAIPQNSAPITSSPPSSQMSTEPSLPTPPVSKHPKKQDSSKDSNQGKVPLPFEEEEDIFASDSIFTSTLAASVSTKKAEHPPAAAPKKDLSNLPSIFDDNSDDLFQTLKPKSATKVAKTSAFLEDDDDNDDFFGVKSSSAATSAISSDVKSGNSFPKQDIFEDDVAILPKAPRKEKDKPIDVSLFDDNVDIFADLADSSAPKQKKSKAKAAGGSIFDDDMDDIFAPSAVKTATKVTPKAKTSPPSQKTSTAVDTSNIFDDPLNALGKN